MKKIITVITLAVSLLVPSAAQSQNVGDILGSLLGRGQASADSTAADSVSGGSRGSGLGDMLGGLAGALGVGSKKNTAENLAGTWAYEGPAVTFKSDNLLLKAGGQAAAYAVEKKIEPYYSKAGLTALVIEMNPDSTFTMKARKAALGGTYAIGADGNIIFDFKVLKSFRIGSMQSYVKLSGKDRMTLTFDVSKLITILEKVGSLTGSSSVQALTSILTQYDGMTAGFDLRKQAGTESVRPR